MRCKFYARGDVLALSATVPILENMGLFVDSEVNFELQPEGAAAFHPAQRIYIHDIEMPLRRRQADRSRARRPAVRAGVRRGLDRQGRERRLQQADPGAAVLVARGGADPRARALSPAKRPRSDASGAGAGARQQHQDRRAHPRVLQGALRSEPAGDAWTRASARSIEARIHDRSRAHRSREPRRRPRAAPHRASGQGDPAHELLSARRRRRSRSPTCRSRSTRTPWPNLPAPKPYREIWVASPQVEGVHLRFGPVARGGLRWSDRRDDFRTEVLDLVKAQQVKNAIIVPVGAKGGFFPKRLPRARRAWFPGSRHRSLQDLPARPARHHRQHHRR